MITYVFGHLTATTITSHMSVSTPKVIWSSLAPEIKPSDSGKHPQDTARKLSMAIKHG
jgi:hypothetical protein